MDERARTTSGLRATSSNRMLPPLLVPNTTAGPIPSAANSTAASLA